jgi:hypothetical protein
VNVVYRNNGLEDESAVPKVDGHGFTSWKGSREIFYFFVFLSIRKLHRNFYSFIQCTVQTVIFMDRHWKIDMSNELMEIFRSAFGKYLKEKTHSYE